MNRSILNNIIRFVLLVLFQVLVLSQLNLGGFVNIYIYILFIIMLPSNIDNRLLLAFSFFTGFSVDLFSGELGFHAFATTLAGFSRIFILQMMMNKAELNAGFTPNMETLNPKQFTIYAYLIILIHNFIYFFIEAFTTHEFWQTILRIFLSSITTLVLILMIQYVFVRKK